jgi:hypothetical protein
MKTRCILVLVLSLTLLHAREAHAGCGDFDGLGRFYGGMLGLATATLTTFIAPAIGKAVSPRIRYWPAVGYTAIGSYGGGLIGFFSTFAGCDPYPHSLYIPSVAALALGVLSAILWPKAPEAAPKSGVLRWLPSARLVFTPLSGGGTAGLVGSF